MSLRVYLSGVFSRPYLLIPGGGGMNIYLAGGISGNLSSLWKSSIGGGKMKIYLAGGYPVKNGSQSQVLAGGGQHLILESYYYARNNQWIEKIIPKLDDFMLDSGAFTAKQGNAGTNINWDAYTEEYADFIKRNKVKKFIELDIDRIVGLKEVERLRNKLEGLVGRQSIPVWHLSRGKDYYLGMCRDYKYIAIGGLVKDNQDIFPEKYFPWFINRAHEAGVKLHGLGYTSLSGLYTYHFDSVDSTAWLYGNRGGYLYKFNEVTGEMEKIDKQEGKRLKSTEAAIHNYREWQKFQQYAIKNL